MILASKIGKHTKHGLKRKYEQMEWQGEQTDSESGKHHLAHAVCCLMFLMWFDLVGGDNGHLG